MGVIAGFFMGILRLVGGLLLLVLRFALPLLVGAGLLALVRRRSGASRRERPRKEAAREPEFHGPVYTVDYQEVPEDPAPAPDGPMPFGYKTAWLAVKCEDPARVLAALEPSSCQTANWATGLAAAYGGQGRFVSPCLDGFVLVVGGEELPEGGGRLAAQFPAVQFFASHRVSGYCRWGMYENGVLTREYCHADGALLRDEGGWTPEELALGFARFPRQDWPEGEDFPDEEDVLDLAAAWGVDPRFEKKTYPPSTGWLCT